MPTWPVDLQTWLSPLLIVEQTFDLEEGVRTQKTNGSGEVYKYGGLSRRWYGSATLMAMHHEDAMAVEARLHMLRRAEASFLIRDMRYSRVYQANLGSVPITGLVNLNSGPANGPIKIGEYLGFPYAGKMALHRIVNAPTQFSATGVANGIEVDPAIRPSWTSGIRVTMGAVNCRAVIKPGSTTMGTAQSLITEGASFSWIQTLTSL